MATLELKYYPAAILKRKAEPVVDFDEGLQKTIEDMAETMYVENGIGLAAPQVGISKRLFVMDVPPNAEGEDGTGLVALINPEIIASEGTIVWEEGCLSFPTMVAEVKRAHTLTVRYQNPAGEWCERDASELEAVCIQHEQDHLNGVTFVDYLSPLKRTLLLRDLKKKLTEMGVRVA